MHRSGTSVLTRGLAALGVDLGTRLMVPMEGNNAKGFWEDIDLNQLNIDLLAALGHDWQSLTPITAQELESERLVDFKLRAIVLLRKKMLGVKIFGMKDPRVSRLLPFWSAVFAHLDLDVSYVVASRNPLSVAESLKNRDGMALEKSCYLWLEHMVPCFTERGEQLNVVVDYDLLIDQPEQQLQRVAAALDLALDFDSAEWAAYRGEFLEGGLRHAQFEAEDLTVNPAIPVEVAEAYALLSRLARDEVAIRSDAVRYAFLRWAGQIDSLHAVFRYLSHCDMRLHHVSAALAEREAQLRDLAPLAAFDGGGTEAGSDVVVETLKQAIAGREGTILGLHQAVLERDGLIAGLQGELGACRTELDNLSAVTPGPDPRDDGLAEISERQREQIGDLHATVARLEAQLAALDSEHGERLAQLNDVTTDLAMLRGLDGKYLELLSLRNETIFGFEQRLAAQARDIAQLRATVLEQDGEIGTLRGALEQAHAQGLLRERVVRDLRQAVSDRDAEIAKILDSKSWRLTKPLRAARREAISTPYRAMRASFSTGGRALWHRLPLSVKAKQNFKSKLFRHLPQLFGSFAAYQSWAAMHAPADRADGGAPLAGGAGHVMEKVSYVPLLQAKPLRDKPAKLICFYLPQFHPIPENNEWWGEGFTEWTNVAPAQPQFAGHYQPHVPGELGAYSLLDPEVQRRQIALAKLYGIEGFCFYFYWFGGKRLLETPIENYLRDPSLDLPFCLCWANENWSRRWDGLDSEILMGQQHSPQDDLAFIAHVAQYMRDPRYIRIDGKPLLLVYRPSLLPSPKATVQRWRDWCREHGLGEIYLAYTQSFEVENPLKYGFDAAIEFPPNNSAPPNITAGVTPLRDNFAATVYDWRAFVTRSEQYKQPDYTLYRSVCPSWDNTARRKNRGTIFQHSSPKLYQRWLENAINYTVQQSPNPDQRLVFVNAWNEWAEGAHLEPDARYGYAYLQATRDALSLTSDQRLGSLLLVTHDCHPHGAQFLILETAKELRDCGFKIYILALGGGRLLDDFVAVGETLNAETAGAGGVASFLQTISAAGTINAITSTVVSGCVVPQLKQLGFNVLSLIHELPGVIRDMKQEGNAALIAAHADKVVFPADLVHQKFIEIAPVAPERVVVRHQGVVRKNPFKHRRDEAHRLVCAKHNLAADVQIVLSIAYMDLRKGPDLFVEMAARVLQQRPNTVFIWIGHAERDMARQVREKIDQLSLDGKVILVDFERDPLMYYAAAAVYALTSREDPFPNVVLESAEAGAPVVAFRGTSGAGQFIVDHDGLLADHLDTGDFARKVCQLLAEPANPVSADVSLRRYALDLLHHLNGFARVSVVVPNYKYERYIARRLDSIFQQGFPVYEVIVLDDASPDGSVAAIKAYLESSGNEARLVVNDSNSGSVFRQWKKGVDLCAGDLVWIAEADDLTAPGFLQELATAFDDPQLALAYCQSKQIDAADNIVADNYLEYTLSASDCCLTDYFRDGKEEIAKSMCIKNTIPNVSAVLMRRAVIAHTLDAVQERLFAMKVAGDWLVYLHVMMKGKVCHSKKALNLHRRHEGSVTGSLAAARHIDEIVAMQKEAMRLVAPGPAAVALAEGYIDQVCDHFKVARRQDVHYGAADVA
ncbi:MAG: glycoside hydrolase family 99-like domain-containing protein [Pseudomonadota bacterium]